MERTNGNGTSSFSTVRFDLLTKLSLMSSLIYSTSIDDCSVDVAVERAIQIHERCDEQVKRLKKQTA